MKKEHALIIALIDVPQNITTGDYFYRTYSPGMAMSQKQGVYVIALSNIHPARIHVMDNADIVVLNDVCDPDLLPLIGKRKEKGLLTIFEIADDMNALQPWNPVYEFYQNRENISLIYRLARYCDGLQFSVYELKRLYGSLNPENAVFPNHIMNPPPDRPTVKGDEFIVGWGGSHGHMEDVASISDQLTKWLLTRQETRLYIMCSESIWKLFKDLPEDKKRYFPPGSLNDYYRFLSGIDVGIAPLRDTAFNRCRSDVKFLEYAISGVVPVVADLEPYRSSVVNGQTGLLFKNGSDLIKTLDRLADDRQMSINISGAAKDYVVRQRLQSDHVNERLEFYEILARRQGQAEIGQTNPEILFENWRNIKGAVSHGRFLELANSGFERLVYSGLASINNVSEKARANEFFLKASAMEPQNYLPFLYGSCVSEEPAASLERAVKLAPFSIKSHILLGEELARQGKLIEALNSFNNALSIFPEYDIPLIRAGRLLKHIGRQEQAEQLFKRASELQIEIPSA